MQTKLLLDEEKAEASPNPSNTQILLRI